MNAEGHPDDKDLFLFRTGCVSLRKAGDHITAAGLCFDQTPLDRELRKLMKEFLKVEREANRLRKNVEISQADQLELVEDD